MGPDATSSQFQDTEGKYDMEGSKFGLGDKEE
jgi:hypothetical protein